MFRRSRKDEFGLIRVDFKKLPIKKTYIPWIIWSIAGFYYFFEIILRMFPGTTAAQLMHTFNINATQFGIFTAFYYWSYTIMQIPAGLIVDRYSIHRTLFFACFFCIFGFFLIHSTTNFQVAELGRFIIGFGSAFAYVSVLKVAAVWLPANHFGLASCIADSLGMVGAMFAETVLVRMNINNGYGSSVRFLIILGIVIALLILFVFKDSPQDKAPVKAISYDPDKTSVVAKLKFIMRNKQIWLIGLVGCLFYLPSSVIGDVWGLPYLKSVYGVSKIEAADMMAMFFAGWTIVGPFLGALSDKIKRRVLPIVLTLILDMALFSVIIFMPLFTKTRLSTESLYVMFFFIGIATGTHPLVFALAKENYSKKVAGTVVAFTNMLIMLGGLLFQPFVGFLLDLTHGAPASTGSVVYSAHDYTMALSIIPISLLLCLIAMKFVKETGHRIKDE